MSEQVSISGTVATASQEKVEVAIRDGEATPSRVVLFLDSDLAAASQMVTFEFRKAPDLSVPVIVLPHEIEPAAGAIAFRNPVGTALVGDWLCVQAFRANPRAGPIATHFLRVRSDFPLARSALVGKGISQGEEQGSQVKRQTKRPKRPKRLAPPAADAMPGVFIVTAGLVALVILGVVSMWLASSGDMGTIATAAFGVIGSVVGAFFGVHAGLGERKRVDQERQIEATKGQMLAAMVPDESKEEALKMLKDYSPDQTGAASTQPSG